jgi:AcrR family transcriptional regulator
MDGQVSPSLRERILDAAATVLRDQGLAAATTREIARQAGCAEGSLYTHFEDKDDLFVAVLIERLPPFIPLLHDLLARAGEESLEAHLEQVAETAIAFYIALLPLAAPLLAAPELREGLRRRGDGPHLANEALAAYLRLEQRLGRVGAEADIQAAPALLLGACMQQALLQRLQGGKIQPEQNASFARALARTLVRGLGPRQRGPSPASSHASAPKGGAMLDSHKPLARDVVC